MICLPILKLIPQTVDQNPIEEFFLLKQETAISSRMRLVYQHQHHQQQQRADGDSGWTIYFRHVVNCYKNDNHKQNIDNIDSNILIETTI